MSTTSKTTSQETPGVDETSIEVTKDVPDKTTENNKPVQDGQDDGPAVQNASNAKLPTYTSETPMQMKFRKSNLFIDVEKANASKD